MACPALIDFEASCLPEYGQSYPIEVAIACASGDSRAWLIRPSERWRYWDWSEEAETLHGISYGQLMEEGQPVAQVLAEMRGFVGDCPVYADAELDAYLLDELAIAAGEKAPFAVHYLGEYFVDQGYTRGQVVAALDAAQAELPRLHIARDDARRLAMVVRLLRDGADARDGKAAA